MVRIVGSLALSSCSVVGVAVTWLFTLLCDGKGGRGWDADREDTDDTLAELFAVKGTQDFFKEWNRVPTRDLQSGDHAGQEHLVMERQHGHSARDGDGWTGTNHGSGSMGYVRSSLCVLGEGVECVCVCGCVCV